MSLSNKKNILNFNSDWFQKPFSKLVASIVGISTIFGIGFAVGSYKESLDWKLEKIVLTQQFNEKLKNEIDDCNKNHGNEFTLSMEQIEKMSLELEKKFGHLHIITKELNKKKNDEK